MTETSNLDFKRSLSRSDQEVHKTKREALSPVISEARDPIADGRPRPLFSSEANAMDTEFNLKA